MRETELSAGTIEYEDAGDGPALVLLHGLMMDASLWDGPIADLSAITGAWRRRCRSGHIAARCTPTLTCRFLG